MGFQEFIKWLGAFAEEGTTGKPSSKRVVALMAGTTLSLGVATLILAKAKWVYGHGGDISLELLAITGPLCTLAGFNYAAGKSIEAGKKKDPEPDKPKEEE